MCFRLPFHLPGRTVPTLLLFIFTWVLSGNVALLAVPGPPTVTNVSQSTVAPALGDPVDITITFSEPVRNVTRDDFSINAPISVRTGVLNISNPSMDQTTYVLTVFGASDSGSPEIFQVIFNAASTDIVDVDEDLALTGISSIIATARVQPANVSYIFTNPAAADFFDPTNWDLGQVPSLPYESILVVNNGLAQGFSGPGVPASLQLDSLLVGSTTGSGTVILNGIDTEFFGPGAALASFVFFPSPPPPAPLQISGGLTVRNTASVKLPPETLVGSPVSGIGPDVDANFFSRLMLTDVDTVSVQTALDSFVGLIPGQSLIRAGRMTGSNSTANTNVFGSFEVEFCDIDTFTFLGSFGGLQLGAIVGGATNTAAGLSRVNNTGTFLAKDIAQLDVFQISIGTIENVFASNRLRVDATFRQTHLNASVFTFGDLRLEEPRAIDSIVNVTFDDSTIEMGPSGLALFGRVDGTPDTASSNGQCNVTLIDSALHTATCYAGMYFPSGGTPEVLQDLATLGMYATALTLEASFLDADDFRLSEDSTLTLKLRGDPPASPTNVDAGARVHSVLQATDAQIAGNIVVDFDFVPQGFIPGMLTAVDLDLLVTSSSTALDDFTGSISINDVPDNIFILGLFVMTVGGVDVVRLSYLIDDSPYAVWAQNRIPTPADQPIEADPDNDGDPNGVHFAFDTNPLAGGCLPNEGKFRHTVESLPGRTGRYLTLTFPVRANAVFPSRPARRPAETPPAGIHNTGRGRQGQEKPTPPTN
ncbi:MAG: hypothetical protein ACFB20_04560, partial [Opitutales bacterium]